jgi:hypothetical protein
MGDRDDEPRNPLKRFRGDYGQSADEEQQSNPPDHDDEVESVNEHRSPQQQIYLPDSDTQQRLRFPENRTDESYLVLEAEGPVKSKPRAHGATAIRRPSDTSGSSSDDGITMGYQPPKAHRRSSKKRSRAVDDTRDDDTGSERNEVVESREGELIGFSVVTIVEYRKGTFFCV